MMVINIFQKLFIVVSLALNLGVCEITCTSVVIQEILSKSACFHLLHIDRKSSGYAM